MYIYLPSTQHSLTTITTWFNNNKWLWYGINALIIRPKGTYYVIASVSVCPSVCPLAISLPLCNSWTPWRISKKPDTNVYQTETMCRSNVLDGWIQGHGLAIYSKSSFTFGPCIETRDTTLWAYIAPLCGALVRYEVNQSEYNNQ